MQNGATLAVDRLQICFQGFLRLLPCLIDAPESGVRFGMGWSRKISDALFFQAFQGFLWFSGRIVKIKHEKCAPVLVFCHFNVFARKLRIFQSVQGNLHGRAHELRLRGRLLQREIFQGGERLVVALFRFQLPPVLGGYCANRQQKDRKNNCDFLFQNYLFPVLQKSCRYLLELYNPHRGVS